MKKSVAMERHFPMDVLADIVQRLPPSARRRACLVCRHWRHIVDDRTTEMQSRPKPIHSDSGSSIAYIIDHQPSWAAWRCRELWRSDLRDVQLVGTCNGLLLLCDNGCRDGGALKVVNPVTEETLPLPRHKAYCFTYHPTTGKYKVVHVPCIIDEDCKFNAMHVLTLGEAAWREMPFGAPRCFLDGGNVSINGTAYWISDAAKLVSFNLDKERVPCSNTPLARGGCYPYLTEVHGRLGFVANRHNRTDMWVLEEEGRRWILRYRLGHRVPQPHFAYAGECVLTVRDRSSFYMHRWKRTPVSSGPRLRHDDVVRVVRREDEGTPVVVMRLRGYFDDGVYQAFAYVETMEPLNVYA